jgi:type II secretory pathway pseudopilin PulG
VSGFTLTEVLISATLTGFVLAGVLSTFLLISRSGFNASAYAAMNRQLSIATERFNRDARLATDLRWQDSTRVTLRLPAGAGPEVTYAFVPASDPAAPGKFIRQVAGQPAVTLVPHVAPDFSFARYRLPGPGASEPPTAANDLETKLLEVRLRAVRPGAQTPVASQLATSVRCVLRNKPTGQ